MVVSVAGILLLLEIMCMDTLCFSEEVKLRGTAVSSVFLSFSNIKLPFSCWLLAWSLQLTLPAGLSPGELIYIVRMLWTCAIPKLYSPDKLALLALGTIKKR